MSSEIIAVLDFGSQYTQVIARRIRECNVHSKIYECNVTAAQLKKENVKGIIFSGGPDSVLTPKSPKPDKKIFELGLPILGICYGVQLFAHLLGGKVGRGTHREYGKGKLSITHPKSMLLRGIRNDNQVWNSHGDKVLKLPKGFKAIAATENSDYAAIEDAEHHFYGLQFHPEVAHSIQGIEIIRNFLYDICKCRGDWRMVNFLDETVEAIRTQVGKQKVILGVSGGVDSSVAAAIIHKAIGNQLTCIFVDNGLLRHNEAECVKEMFKTHFNIKLKAIDASKLFLQKLKKITDPEKKRKIIGKLFVDAFEATLKNHGKDAAFLGQGTLYPDVIESVAINNNPAALIKTHHNVGGLPKRMKLKLLEPLRELFKDEVRTLGAELGVPDEVLWRHPFPGPGLAVRIMGEITNERLQILRHADSIFIEELHNSSYYHKVWQAFCVFLPIQSVGVMGDERTYDYTIALRAVESTDGMTADWAKLPHELLQKISSRITNEVQGINRVVYDISSKPPSTIEWE
jgi:GMP synthase (glutamine-hydrolysing)